MKHLARLLSLLILVSAGVFFSNCGGSDDKKTSEEEVQLGKLKANSWILSSAKLDNTSDDRFDGADLTLTISGNYSEGGKYNYSLSSGIQVDASPFPPSGKWKFGSPATSQLVRLDSELNPSFADVDMTYSIDATTLTITISNYTGSNFVVGKTESTKSVEGTWVFVFTKI